MLIKDSKILIISLTRRGSLDYALEMCNLMKSYQPICVFSTRQKLEEELEQRSFSTYSNSWTFIFQSLLACIRVPLFLIQQKPQNQTNTIYCTVFHPWNILFILWGNIFNYRTILTVHDFKTHAGERNMIVEALQKLQMRLADKVVFLTEFVKHQALDWSGSIRDKSIIVSHPIPSGISANTLEHNKTLKVLALGRMKDYKGMEMLLKALEGLDINHLTLAGLGASKYDSSKDKIRTIDAWLSKAHIQELLSEHHLLVLPYQEASQSGVLALGIAAEMPMLVTKVGGLTEQVTHDAALFSSTSVSELRKEIFKIRDDATLFNNLKSNIAALKLESKKRIRIQIEELFRDV